jgi:tetratricopeptide (TPR) repeat protein
VLEPAPPLALHWYDVGVEGLREGSYAGARTRLLEATRIHPNYLQAYVRLVDACTELDDEKGAKDALAAANQIARGLSLPDDELLRLKAVEAVTLRQYDTAIGFYRTLAEHLPTDPGAWVDLGRAEEAGARWPQAQAHYLKALEIDPQFAAAHLRLGSNQAQLNDVDAAFASFNEAGRLYRMLANVEGEAETFLRRATVLNNSKRSEEARQAAEKVLDLAGGDRRYLSHQVRARFELARAEHTKGNLSSAQAVAQSAADDAIAGELFGIAANGLTDLAGAMASAGDLEVSDLTLLRAIDVAHKHDALREEMRATLQLAAVRAARKKWEDAIQFVERPAAYYKGSRREATARSILAQAYEGLERGDDALSLANDALRSAEARSDAGVIATARYNLAGQYLKMGRFSEAEREYDELVQLHRRRADSDLPFALLNRAEALILLGRGREAAPLLDEVDAGVRAGLETYVLRRNNLLFLRALLASIDQQWPTAERFASTAYADSKSAAHVDDVTYARVLAEHARARQGKSRTAIAAIEASPDTCQSPAVRRQVAYWVAQTLLAREAWPRAYAVAREAWAAPGARDNSELRWRLAALAALASRRGVFDNESASMPAHSEEDLRQLRVRLGDSAASYLDRPDLAALLTALRR